MHLRKATEQDLTQVAVLYRDALRFPGCTWDEEYPTEHEIQTDYANGDLYVLAQNDLVIGAVSVASEPELADLPCWTIPNATEIARVVIARSHLGQGLAKQMLCMLFNQLRAEGHTAIRLAAACCNPAAVCTYQALEFSFLTVETLFGNRYHLCEKAI